MKKTIALLFSLMVLVGCSSSSNDSNSTSDNNLTPPNEVNQSNDDNHTYSPTKEEMKSIVIPMVQREDLE
jgi:PBP1b-binding outer membrane lipoprotein LpoB